MLLKWALCYKWSIILMEGRQILVFMECPIDRTNIAIYI